jgi:hypothetical protein
MTTDNWIWEQQDWPGLRWQEEQFAAALKQLYFLSGQIHCLNALLSPKERQHLSYYNLIESVGKQRKSIRQQLSSSLKLQLELPIEDTAIQSLHSQKWAEVIIDSCTNHDKAFTLERLVEWHQAIQKEESSQLRQGKDNDGTVKVLFELIDLAEWFNHSDNDDTDPLIRIAVSYLRMACIKPFNSHNTEICRMFGNLALNQSMPLDIPLYIDPVLISDENSDYLKQLDNARRGNTDISEWIAYFLEVIKLTLEKSLNNLMQSQKQPEYWLKVAECGLSSIQVDALKGLFNNPDPKASISASEYQKFTGVSKPSATRHLAEMLSKGCIIKLGAGGRSTRYRLNLENSSLLS